MWKICIYFYSIENILVEYELSEEVSDEKGESIVSTYSIVLYIKTF